MMNMAHTVLMARHVHTILLQRISKRDSFLTGGRP
jgi:hypothetical protein